MNLKELHSFKMSDAVKFHDQLNPLLFHGQHLDSTVRKKLLVIAEDFLNELGISQFKVKDVTISGSNAAYSYTPHSDIDLHVIVDMGQFDNDEVYQELFNAKKSVYNDKHDIKIKDIPIELYVQPASDPHVSLGEYSILNDHWIKFPLKRRANVDQNNTRAKYEQLKRLCQTALRERDLKKVGRVIKKIKQYRKAGLANFGEFGPENLAYKMVKNQEYLQKLYDLRDKLHSAKLSFETMHQNPKKIAETIGPHEKKELEMMLHGSKPAALIDFDELKQPNWQDAIQKNNWTVEKVDIASIPTRPGTIWASYKPLIIVSKDPNVAKSIKRLMLNTLGKYPNGAPESYHIQLGKLLGYGEEDIEHFLNHTGYEKPKISEENTTLQKIYGNKLPKHDEIFWNYVSGNDLKKPLEIKTMSKHSVMHHLLGQYRVEHIDDLMDMLDDDQVETIAQYMADPKLSDNIVVVDNNKIIDGNHRALAAALKGVPIKYVDLSEDELKEANIDNNTGWGAVGNNREVNYFGLRVNMTPSTFLKLAAPLNDEPNQEMIDYIQKGGAIGSPHLYITVPKEWESGDFSMPARVSGHEGRHRMKSIFKIEGDKPVEVHLFPYGYRNRHLTPEIVNKLNKSLFAEKSRNVVLGPLFTEAVTEGLKFNSRKRDNSSKDLAKKIKDGEGLTEDHAKTPAIGINVRSDSDIDYADLIVDGKKKYESRNTDSLRPYVGKTVGIIRTGSGPAVAIGQATIGEPIVADEKKFNKLRKKHLVPKGSKLDINSNGTKYLYPIIDPVRWDDEKLVKQKGIVARKIEEQGVAEAAGYLDELGFADSLNNLSLPDREIIDNSTVANTIGQKPVRIFNRGSSNLYFFATDTNILALVLLDGTYLKAIKNFTDEKGMVYSLLNYIVNLEGLRINVSPTEPLTAEGFKWLLRLAKNTHGLRLTTSDGHAVDTESLKREWNNAKLTKEPGKIGLMISEKSESWKKRLIENENSLMPFRIFEYSDRIIEASGYIPSEKEKNDPRFKTALTVDIHPNSIKKNAKAFGFKTSRAGIPPLANPNGKVNEVKRIGNILRPTRADWEDWDFSEKRKYFYFVSHSGATVDVYKDKTGILAAIDGKVLANLDGEFQNAKFFKIDSVASIPSLDLYASELYKALILDKNLTLISGDQQTYAGSKIWDRLSKVPNITVEEVNDLMVAHKTLTSP